MRRGPWEIGRRKSSGRKCPELRDTGKDAGEVRGTLDRRTGERQFLRHLLNPAELTEVWGMEHQVGENVLVHLAPMIQDVQRQRKVGEQTFVVERTVQRREHGRDVAVHANEGHITCHTIRDGLVNGPSAVRYGGDLQHVEIKIGIQTHEVAKVRQSERIPIGVRDSAGYVRTYVERVVDRKSSHDLLLLMPTALGTP